MAEQKNRHDQSGSQKGAAGTAKKEQMNDPGRTPGSAEGDRETVEEDLRDKGVE